MCFAELQDGRTQITDMSLAVGNVSTGLPRRSNCWNSSVSGSNATVAAILRYTSVSALTILQQTKLNSRTADHWIVSYPILSSPTVIQYTHIHTHTHTHTYTHTQHMLPGKENVFSAISSFKFFRLKFCMPVAFHLCVVNVPI